MAVSKEAVEFVSKHKYFSQYATKVLDGNDHIDTRFDPIFNSVLDKTFTGEINRLIINIPPGFGKTARAVWSYVARGFAINPTARFIHASYSDKLVQDNSSKIRDLINHTDYRQLFPYVTFKEDSQAKGLWKTDRGGAFLASPSGGAITGFRAGLVNSDYTFSGCFPYWELVHTDRGSMPIGEIVEGRIPLNVLSYNTETGSPELQPVSQYFTNPPSQLVEVGLSCGSTFQCTPCHEIYTHRGKVRADELRSSDKIVSLSDPLYLMDRKAEFFSKSLSRYTSITRSLNNFARGLVAITPARVRQIFCNVGPCLAGFDLPNNASANPKSIREGVRRFGAGEDFDNLVSSEFSSRASFENRKRTMSFGVDNVFRSGSVCKVLKGIVSRIPVKMADFGSDWARPDKRKHNDTVNLPCSYNAVDREAEVQMPTSVRCGFQDPASDAVGDILLGSGVHGGYLSRLTTNATLIAGRVKAFITGDRRPVFVRECGHVDKTYCLEVRGNHNFTVSKARVVVSNCFIIDDPLKPDDALSDTKRDFINQRWHNTFKSRLAHPDVPVIVIMQRIHEEDFTWELLENSGEEWHHLVLPAYIDDQYEYKQSGIYIEHGLSEGTLWDVKATDVQALGLMNNIQYSQEPTPAKGEVYERHWFKRFRDIPSHVKNWTIYCDTASKVKKYNDYSVFQLWAQTTDNKGYLVKQWRKKVKVPFLMDELEGFYAECLTISGQPRIAINIEDKDSGVGLIQGLELKKDANKQPYKVNAIQRKEGKYARAVKAAPYVKDGDIYIMDGAEGDGVITEATKFKADDSHKHDDQLDPMADFINYELPNKGYSLANL